MGGMREGGMGGMREREGWEGGFKGRNKKT